KHDGFVARTYIQPHDIGQLFQKPRIARQLESLGPMRFDVMASPQITDRGFADSLPGGHEPATPLRLAFGFRLQRGIEHRLDSFRTVSSLAPSSRSDLPQAAR